MNARKYYSLIYKYFASKVFSRKNTLILTDPLLPVIIDNNYN